jgi:hypothetical protein
MRHARSLGAFLLAGTLSLAVASCSNDGGGAADQPPPDLPTSASTGPDGSLLLWPAPDDAEALATKAGVVFEVIEHLKYHVHAHLDVFVDGRAVQVPPGVGINIDDPAVQHFEGALGSGYGGIEEPGCEHPCISALHTHDPDGVLHTESATEEPNTLGQFFIEWDVALTDKCVAEFCAPETPVAVYVDGRTWQGDPTEIELQDHREIAVVIGSPPREIPDSFDFTGV